ncbi:MAG: hypothetical protein IIY19_07340 [Lachnospiraceae bacterium]|nr:hypothetical protein [Lachnospiraceae bacterium]
MDKGIIMWCLFLAVFAAGMLISRRIKNSIIQNGIETYAVVSRIVDDGTQSDIDMNVYVTFTAEDGEEIEAILSNPRTDLKEGQQVRIKYHPKYRNNARLV